MVGSTAVSSDKGVVLGGLSWSGHQPSHLTRVLCWGVVHGRVNGRII